MSPPTAFLTVHCPGKINLHLEVLGKRPDGYHELRTLFAAVGVWDLLVLRPDPGELQLEVEPAGVVSTGEDNLVLRAARELQRRTGTRLGAHLSLYKRIPVGGGMGGGSANAAAALVGLNHLWRVGASERELHEVAAGLGADVPFFLVGGVAWGTGRGEEIKPLPDLPPWWVVLLPGPEVVSTAAVYAALGAPPLGTAPPSRVYDWVRRGGELPLESCRNDLEPAVMERFPGVSERLEELLSECPRLAMVSGSGGTVFALFEDQEVARECADRLVGRGAVMARLLSREASLLRPSAGEETWRSPMSGLP